MKKGSSLLNFLRWDLRVLIALFLLLAVIVGFSLAQTAGTLLYTFDFGTGVLADKETNAINVKGGATLYPTVQGALTFGWSSADVQAFSRGSTVADKINRDYNFSSTPETFKVSGLSAGNYVFRFTVGDLENTLSSLIQIGDRSVSITKTASWGTVDLPVQVGSTADIVNILFSSRDGSSPWGVNGLAIYSQAGTTGEPSFLLTLKPSSQQVVAGGVAEFIAEVTPVNNYGNTVSLSLTQALPGMKAEFLPTTLTQLPGQSTLRFTTTTSTSPNSYTFTVRATGTDSQAVTKTAGGTLAVGAVGSNTPSPTNTNVPPMTDTGTEPVVIVPKTQEQLHSEFKTIEDYVAIEQEKILSAANFTEIDTIARDLGHIPIVEIPAPTNGVESSLQTLVRKGIISSTVDTAPILPEIERPKQKKGLFEWLFSKVSSPAN